jgi:hypothetical protein
MHEPNMIANKYEYQVVRRPGWIPSSITTPVTSDRDLGDGTHARPSTGTWVPVNTV